MVGGYVTQRGAAVLLGMHDFSAFRNAGSDSSVRSKWVN